MNIVLINPTPADHYSPCIRTLTAFLKMHGHTVRQIFLPADTYSHLHVREGYIMQMEQSMVKDLVRVPLLTGSCEREFVGGRVGEPLHAVQGRCRNSTCFGLR